MKRYKGNFETKNYSVEKVKKMKISVDWEGIEPSSSSMRTRYSTVELPAHILKY
jgi:hypothetical protein